MDRVRALGIRLLADAPKPGADGKQIVFLHPKDTAGVLVELCADAPVAWEALRVPRGDGEATVHAAGPADAPPLLAFHGANGAAAQLRPLADRWARRFRVLAVDLSGHGGTPAAGPLSWSAFAADAVAVLDGLGLDDAHAFGYSMGGGVALALAAAHPERVRRLAVFATHVQWDAPLAGRFLADAAPDTQPEAVVEILRAWHGDGWRDVLARTKAFVRQLPLDPIPDEMLARVSHPTRVLHGDSDALFPVEHAVALYRVLPNARLSVLPGATHALGSLDAAAVARDIAEWLDDPRTP
jgi:pimeloyl-ACP methyl ester carboxylesterase